MVKELGLPLSVGPIKAQANRRSTQPVGQRWVELWAQEKPIKNEPIYCNFFMQKEPNCYKCTNFGRIVAIFVQIYKFLSSV